MRCCAAFPSERKEEAFSGLHRAPVGRGRVDGTVALGRRDSRLSAQFSEKLSGAAR
jgi:hypothetical protein